MAFVAPHEAKQAPKVIIAFSSQSGTAMRCAQSLADTLGKVPTALSASQPMCLNRLQEVELFPGDSVVFVVSSFGKGEAPMNGKNFEKLIRDLNKNKSLLVKFKDVKYAVLGFGNSMFPLFCGFSKLIDAQMEKIGAKRFLDRLDADSINPKKRDVLVKEWMDKLAALLELDMKLYLEANPVESEDALLRPDSPSISCGMCISRTNSSNNSPALSRQQSPQRLCLEAKSSADGLSVTENVLYKGCVDVKVKNAKFLTSSGSSRRVIHVELDTTGFNVHYNPGDSVGIPCRNDNALVSAILNRLQVRPESLISIKNHDSSDLFEHIPEKVTARFALTCCCDLTSKPSHRVLQVLFKSAKSSQDLRKLEEIMMSSELLDQLGHDVVNVLDLLEMFPSAFPPISSLCSALPSLVPRFYSIGSSPLTDPNSVHIAFAVIENEVVTTQGKTKLRKGVCTSWLESLVMPMLKDEVSNNSSCIRIPVFVKTSTEFSDLLSADKNLVMIGPGTGCVPFRAILRHLSAQGKGRGQRWLFVGHRHKDQDFIYRDEWESLKSQGIIDNFSAVFSRDATTSANSLKYVHDAILQQSNSIYELLTSSETHFLICGKNAVFESVQSCFKTILIALGGMSDENADKLIENMIETGRLVAEVWG